MGQSDSAKEESATLEISASMPPKEKRIDAPTVELLIKNGDGEVAMPEEPAVELNRKQLYDEIWEISVAGVAKKYDIPYAQMMKQVKEADIPIPPSGYWTKLNFGKPVTKIEFTGLADEVIPIYRNTLAMQAKKTKSSPQTLSTASKQSEKAIESSNILKPDESVLIDSQLNVSEQNPFSEEKIQIPLQSSDEPENYENVGQTYNVYDRETLYKEVWEQPVTEVAKRYKVSDVAIHKVCKALEIPTPPLGYWAKLRAGKPVKQMPLPESSKPETKTGIRTGAVYQPEIEKDTLAFLSEEDKAVVLSVAAQIIIPDENDKMHSKIISHRKRVLEWKKKLKEIESKGWNRRSVESAPFLADTISEETLPRVCHIIDALIKAMEPLGCALTNDLEFVVNGETVRFTVSESKDEVVHILTKEENMQLLKYEEEKRRHSWVSKPQIRKYDRPYNGRISLTVYNAKSFRDCKSYVIEDKLGDIMIELYEAAEVLKKAREAREEAERKRQEEEQRKEERRKRYNIEVDRTLALTNLAQDYDTACKIRNYIAVVEASGSQSTETMEWVEWAKSKADWYDPTVAKEDDFFGKREHEKGADQKKLEHAGYRWW